MSTGKKPSNKNLLKGIKYFYKELEKINGYHPLGKQFIEAETIFNESTNKYNEQNDILKGNLNRIKIISKICSVTQFIFVEHKNKRKLFISF